MTQHVPRTAPGALPGMQEWIRQTSGAVNALIKADSELGNYADDAAAAAGGVPLYGRYRNGSVMMVRVS